MWPRRSTRRKAPQTALGGSLAAEAAPGVRFYANGPLLLCVSDREAALWDVSNPASPVLIDRLAWFGRVSCE